MRNIRTFEDVIEWASKKLETGNNPIGYNALLVWAIDFNNYYEMDNDYNLDTELDSLWDWAQAKIYEDVLWETDFKIIAECHAIQELAREANIELSE